MTHSLLVNAFSERGHSNVAIIGAGASGLIAAVEFSKIGIGIKVFEKEFYIGGVWKYSPEKVVYPSLVTNIPKQVMEISPDFPFDDKLPSFIGHEDVQNYLEAFVLKNCEVFNGTRNENCPIINFGCEISNIHRTLDRKWRLKYRRQFSPGRSESFVEEEENFDCVVICNGHYNVPVSPVLPGLDDFFCGCVLHSSEYKKPEMFANKTVLIVGARSSATDLAREISALASQVHISDRNSDSGCCTIGSSSNIYLHGGLDRVDERGRVLFTDDTRSAISVDYLIWCTGFVYDYPFLNSFISQRRTPLAAFPVGASDEVSEDAAVSSDPASDEDSCQPWTHLEVHDNAVRPLYLDMFPVGDDSIAFLGLPQRVAPFGLFRTQAELVAKVMGSRVRLPPVGAQWRWLRERETAFLRSGSLMRAYHSLGDDQWRYLLELLELGGGVDETTRRYLATNRELYEDNARHMPAYTGAPDSFRRRCYHVDRTTGEWWVDNEEGTIDSTWKDNSTTI